MKVKVYLTVIAALFLFGSAGNSFAAHSDVKGTTKGTVTRIEPVEVELTIRDDKGSDIKVRTKDASAFKPGDKVILKDGKVLKEVKPITGGY